MQEEYHGIKWPEGPFKLLYGWGTMNVNVWLPSLCELVGYDPAHQWTNYGTYAPAMQGLNISSYWYVDAQGGDQFAYFKQYNDSGGGEKLWNCGGSEQFLLRSVRWDNTVSCWMMLDATYFHTPLATDSLAIHPAVENNRAIRNTG